MGKIDISHFVLSTKVLGPYVRSALWVHGCCFDCEGCIAGEMNRQISDLREIAELAGYFSDIDDTEGITVSGGEPFLQAAALYEMIDLIQAKRDYGVIIYTGFEYEELRNSGDMSVRRLLACTDILIDGRYVKSLDDGKAYRGSSNQRIIQLSDRYKDVFETYYFENNKRNIEIDVEEKNVYLVGVPSKYGLETWRKFKKKAGCESD
ncbi:MAG: radical SAM protein [Lachnospiraceae bacterium]|nr:radical SAM protein [Lachnospiraceae bacterium]